MSDLEQVDVTTTEDDSSNVNKCAYCGCQKDGVLVFYCEQCSRWIHASCLHSGPPSSILADNYFVFKCTNCSPDNKETFERMKLTWVQVVMMTLYNLAQTSLGKQGYFKWKEDICDFIDKHWDSLFGNNKKRTPQWSCTVCSILSAGNPHRFQSGYGVFRDTGWWRLVDPTQTPEYKPGAAIVSTPKPRNSRRSHFGMSSSRSSARKRHHALLAQQAAETKAKQACMKEDTDEESLPVTGSSPRKEMGSKNGLKSDSCDIKKLSQESGNGETVAFVDSPRSSLIADSNSMPASPASSHSSDSRSLSSREVRIDPVLPLLAISDDEEESNHILDDCIKKEYKEMAEYRKDPSAFVINKPSITKREVLITKQDSPDGSKDEQIHDGKSKPTGETQLPAKILPMSLYDEQKLLKKLLSMPNSNNDVHARQLKRKLILRQKKRALGLPIFNFDSTVRQLRAKEKHAPLSPDSNGGCNIASIMPLQSNEHRILDRFLSSDARLHTREENGRTFRQKLIGCGDAPDQQMIISPYTQRMLKPYIRRDNENKPPKLKLLEEIVSQHHRHDPQWKAEPSSPIDFSYVRPRYIPTINAMCSHFFWPGVDLSESLQYPDFSVVALYKKMVIGFGFLVPDVSFNQAYISFLLVHPDWQHAGIGTFMLYHLIQTFMGKDVTLHVSASNPAMLLYQRFGFKPERFEADFYDKYMPPDTVECTHAFFMRLRR